MSLCCKNVSYRVDGRCLIRHFDVTVNPGEVLAVVGNNGAGKSTLLSLLAGCPLPSDGEVLFESQAASDWSIVELAARRAILPQSPSVAFDFKVSEIIRLGALPHTLPEREIDTGLLEVMRRMDILHLQQRGYFSLSGGERQRVHLARVLLQLVLNPGVARYLLLDEPLAMLDMKHQYELMEHLRSLVSDDGKAGIGVVLITHDLNIAMRYADRTCFVKSGSCYAQGNTPAVLTPENIRAVFDVDASISNQGISTWPVKKRLSPACS